MTSVLMSGVSLARNVLLHSVAIPSPTYFPYFVSSLGSDTLPLSSVYPICNTQTQQLAL